MTVGQLASAIGRPRTSVSKAINQNRFSKLREQIREELAIA
ncbi:hypothetical protein CfE428DRAFT_5819 [Chthoniobacter flavus Ellin428]|uniref:Uncharacterized protein n=1 Tax=Chthoniobacter flavus Ellin428 TaxID=497964 RepID=B4DA79_9BACT|nr:hypothetical protein CfE428DRAFT_5819 [Chthoniobacter flavus Ellin428]TCO87272.1 hypothetical protein EV701_123109 [Chthoniobacter flavus]